MKYYQYCNNVKKNLVPIVHQPCLCTSYVQESKKLRDLISNKDERKLLARRNGNNNPIWSWNDSEGLFYTKINEPTMINSPTNVRLNTYSYISTEKQNSECFTYSGIEGTQKVRKLLKHIYWPVTSNFKT